MWEFWGISNFVQKNVPKLRIWVKNVLQKYFFNFFLKETAWNHDSTSILCMEIGWDHFFYNLDSLKYCL